MVVVLGTKENVFAALRANPSSLVFRGVIFRRNFPPDQEGFQNRRLDGFTNTL